MRGRFVAAFGSFIRLIRAQLDEFFAFVSLLRSAWISVFGSMIRSIPKSVHSNDASSWFSSPILPLCRVYLARLNRLTASQFACLLSPIAAPTRPFDSALRALLSSVCLAATVSFPLLFSYSSSDTQLAVVAFCLLS